MIDPNLKPPEEDEAVLAACPDDALEHLTPGLKAKAQRGYHMLKVVDRYRQECEEDVERCAQALAQARAPFARRMFIYMMKCGLLARDIKFDAASDYMISDRVCDKWCQHESELKTTLEPVDFGALDAICENDEESTKLFAYTQETVKLVTALDKSFGECTAP